jgi:hypothetical protein
MHANTKAAAMSSELFNLVNRFKALEIELRDAATTDAQHDAVVDFNAVVCQLAAAYEAIRASEVVVDAYRDPADRTFASASSES